MAKALPISTTKSYFLEIRNTIIKGVSLAGAAAVSVLEIFDGAIDSIATFTIVDGGSSYSVGDKVTLVTGETGSISARAVLRVTQIDDNSPSSSVSSSISLSPSSSISSSRSTSISSSPSSSVSSSVSPSVSRSSSISSSPSSSLSVSSSISSSISSSASPSTSISSSPSTSISSSVSTSISTSPSSSPSPSESASTSISASPSTSISSSISLSPSSSISASPSTSISSSVSSSISSSISLSPSTSISSSPSASLSPSVGAGRITAAEIITAGGGYTAGNTYLVVSTTGSGTLLASFNAATVTDEGTSVAKLQCVANESASPLVFDKSGILTTKGISVRISGASAKGHLTYE